MGDRGAVVDDVLGGGGHAHQADEHWRSMVMPDTVTGMPARSADWRAMFVAGRALLQGAAHGDVIDLASIDPGLLDEPRPANGRRGSRRRCCERAAIGPADGSAAGRRR
jgi:hypothetical protein